MKRFIATLMLAFTQLVNAQVGADCDGNGLLNANDFQCFNSAYAAAQSLPVAQQITSYANCDGSTAVPVLTANDFQCFANKYAAGLKPPPSTGWTDITPPVGAMVFYVSSSTGSDSNPGTRAAPFASLAKGYASLRDGQPDQVLLKCGDTFSPIGWTKASNNPAKKMVCASYGLGNRPRLVGGGFYLGQQNKGGLAFVGLEVVPSGLGGASNGFVVFAPWHDILIEDCYVGGFNVNIAMQEIDATRLSNISIRRCIIVDGAGGSGHNQGLFVGSCDNLLVEECVFDLNGNYPGFEKRDMFCHNVYLHQTNGPSRFLGNITARSCSHGVQQRSGGVMDGNLALENPIGLFQGDASQVHNYFRYNTVVDSRNISATELRGFGFWLNGGAGSDVTGNVAGHQHQGTANCEAFNFDGMSTAVVSNNVAYDWQCPGHVDWGHGFTGGVGSFSFNQSYQPVSGQCAFGLSGHSINNKYAGHDAQTGVGSGWTEVPMPIKDISVRAYMAHLGRTGGLPEYMIEARKQSKQNWRVEFTAGAYGSWARSQFGISSPSGS